MPFTALFMEKPPSTRITGLPLIGIDIDDTIADWAEEPPYEAYPSPYAQNVLRRWIVEETMQILYITSRPRERRSETETWLRQNRFPHPDRVLYEEDSVGGKPATLRKLGAPGLIDDMPSTQSVAAAEGLLAFWRDIPKNQRFTAPPPHENLIPWKNWLELDQLVREKISFQ